MKKYLLGLFAIALAVGFSAFTSPGSLTKKRGIVFLEYVSGAQTLITSYNQTTFDPSLGCTTGSTLCFLRVNDADNNIIQSEWRNGAGVGYFETFDIVNTAGNSLNDEAVTTDLKKKL